MECLDGGSVGERDSTRRRGDEETIRQLLGTIAHKNSAIQSELYEVQ